MTTGDIVFLVLLGLQVLSLIAMGVAGWLMLQTFKRARRQVTPAVKEGQALAELGKAMAISAAREGTAMAGRVKGVTQKVKQRVETTRRIAAELKPQGSQAAEAIGEQKVDLSRKARTIGDLAKRLGRVKSAADRAVEAARTPAQVP
ncbi:MAG: hypothetical protein ACK47B_11395 [Armatimonadota bacterium]